MSSTHLYRSGEYDDLSSVGLTSAFAPAESFNNLKSAGEFYGTALASASTQQLIQDLLRTGTTTNTTTIETSTAPNAYSQVETAILNASRPIDITETDVITIHGHTGVWANKSELANWRGAIPITQYAINDDANPEIIRKRNDQTLVYEQEVAVRYLRPPTPPPPGEIVIRQEKNTTTSPAPPLVIRQQPPRPETPAPLVVREAPPKPPAPLGQKVITISGKRLPPPPRKVVIERLAPLPSKPQSLIVERWLPYKPQKRRVVFQRNNEPDQMTLKPKNLIIQWDAPQVQIKKEMRDLGVIRANPVEYLQRYSTILKTPNELPTFVRDIKPPAGVVLASDFISPSVMELEGDLHALRLIDLDAHGLSEYKFLSGDVSASFAAPLANTVTIATSGSLSGSFSGSNALIAELFAKVDRNSSGKITMNEAEKLLLVLNSSLGRSYGDNEVQQFFRALDMNRDGSIDFNEFKTAIVKLF